MSRENVEVVRRAYEEAYAKRSVEGADDWISEDFRFHMRAEFPGQRFYQRDEITEIWADLDETYSDFSLVPDEYADTGDYVLVTLNQSARLRESDVRVESTIYHVWEVRDGKAIEAWTYSDRADALEAVGLRA